MVSDSDDTPAGIVLKLYVAGMTSRSKRALDNLHRICRGSSSCTVEVIDIVERPEIAEEQRILATPVVIRDAPLPPRRIVGDLSDADAVALCLDLPLGGAA